MAELKLPELGENIETVDVSAILVSVGDQVRPDQPVIEVETEKASLEVPSTFEGRIEKLLVSAGDKVTVGQVLLVVETVPGAVSEGAISEPARPTNSGRSRRLRQATMWPRVGTQWSVAKNRRSMSLRSW